MRLATIQTLKVLQGEASSCTACRAPSLLHRKDGNWPKPLFQRGYNGRTRVLLVAEAPNLADTFEGEKQYLTIDANTDPSGKQVFAMLQAVGLEPNDVLVTNSVLCLPVKRGDKFPVKATQVKACIGWIEQLIGVLNPPVVVTLGVVALATMNRLEPHGLMLASAVGRLHNWNGRKLLPLAHPGMRARRFRSASQQIEDMKALVPFIA